MADDDTNLVTLDDVAAALLRSLTSDEQTFGPKLLAQVSSQLRAKRPTVDDRIALHAADPRNPDALDPVVVAGMLAGVVKRTLVNPRGLWSASAGEGPFTNSETYAGARGGDDVTSIGALVITDADLKLIDRAPAIGRTIYTPSGLSAPPPRR